MSKLIGWGEVVSFPLVMMGGSSSSSQPKDVTPPAIAALRTPFANTITSLLGTTGQGSGGNPLSGIPSFDPSTSSNLAAPIGSNEQSLLDSLMTDQNSGASAAANSYLTDVLNGKYLPGSSNSNPFLNAAIQSAQAPTLQGLTNTLGQVLPGQFTQAGQFIQPKGSSAFDRAAALATGQASQALSGIASGMSSQEYENERTLQQGAVPLAQSQVQTTIANLNAQALPRLIQQQGIQNGLSEYQSRLQTLLGVLGSLSGSPLTAVGNTSNSSSTTGIAPILAAL